jgi:uncharacterized DUF497 family protein
VVHAVLGSGDGEHVMDFEWDEDKRNEVAATRGIDFAEAALIFERPVLTWEDRRKDYREARDISIGTANGKHFVS